MLFSILGDFVWYSGRKHICVSYETKRISLILCFGTLPKLAEKSLVPWIIYLLYFLFLSSLLCCAFLKPYFQHLCKHTQTHTHKYLCNVAWQLIVGAILLTGRFHSLTCRKLKFSSAFLSLLRKICFISYSFFSTPFLQSWLVSFY